ERQSAQREQRIAQIERDAATPRVAVGELRERDERIALLEGERQGLEWRVQELEGRLAASEHKWEGIVQDLEERLRSREQAFEESRAAADKHRAEMAARDEGGAEQVAAVLELEEELGAIRTKLTEIDVRATEATRRAEEAEVREREARQRAATAEGELLRLRNAPPQIVKETVEKIVKDTAELEAAQAEIVKLKEKLALASSQTDVWMT